MCCFKRKVKLEKVNIVGKLEVLIKINKNEEIAKMLEKLVEEARFIYPSQKLIILNIENKISNIIDDIRILLSSSKTEKVMIKLHDISILLAERKAKL